LYRGVDFGWSNSFCCLWIGYDPRDGAYYVFDEHHDNKNLMEDHVDEIIRKEKKHGLSNPRSTFCDPSGGQIFHELTSLLKRKALQKSVWLGNNDVTFGIEKVRQKLKVRDTGLPKLFVHTRCSNVATGFANYEQEQAREDKPSKDKPKKIDDHAMDALRYVIATVSKGDRKHG
jgi:phage terminase large subunit